MGTRFKDFLGEQAKKDLKRTSVPVAILKKGKIKVGGQTYCNLSSNDYLGFSSHPDLCATLKNGADIASSSSASPLITGYTNLHKKLERAISRLKNKPAALIFSSGWQTNVGVIDSLVTKGDAIFCDRLSHASIIDGCRLSGARMFRFRHNNLDHLKTLLQKHRNHYKEALIITESVFSMEGDLAPLQQIADLKNKYKCLLMVDEAHATGLFGENGSGVVDKFKVHNEVDIIMGTFSKALAGLGGYIATSKTLRDYLLNSCRSYIFSTSLPPSIVLGNTRSIELLVKEHRRATSLLENASWLRSELKNDGFTVMGTSQIIPIIFRTPKKAIDISKKLKKRGWWVVPVRPPTVPKGSSRLRISLSYDHSRSQLNRFRDDLVRNI